MDVSKSPNGVMSAPLLSTPASSKPMANTVSPVVFTPPSARQQTPRRLNRSSHDSTGRHGRNKSMTDWFKTGAGSSKKVRKRARAQQIRVADSSCCTSGRRGEGRSLQPRECLQSRGRGAVRLAGTSTRASYASALLRYSRNLFTGGTMGSKQAAPRDGTMFEFFALCSFANTVTTDMPVRNA